MAKATATHGTAHRASHKHSTNAEPTFWQKAAIVAGATGGGLLAVSLIGAAPVAIAGAAGYLAYREISKKSEHKEEAASAT